MALFVSSNGNSGNNINTEGGNFEISKDNNNNSWNNSSKHNTSHNINSDGDNINTIDSICSKHHYQHQHPNGHQHGKNQQTLQPEPAHAYQTIINEQKQQTQPSNFNPSFYDNNQPSFCLYY